MSWRRFILAMVAGGIVSGVFVSLARNVPLWSYCWEAAVLILPGDAPLLVYDVLCHALLGFVIALPAVIVALVVYALLPGPRDVETRCRKCGYILRSISEPRCAECGERI